MRRFSFVALGLLVACSSSPEDEVGVSTSGIRNCPIGDPLCKEPPPAVTCEGAVGAVYASADSAALGQSVTVSWSATLPLKCGEQVLLNGLPVARAGSSTFTINYNDTFTLMVGSKVLAQKQVTTSYPNPFRISESTVVSSLQLRDALLQPGEKVILEDGLDLDVSNLDLIHVASGVTLTSEVAPLVLSPPIGPSALLRGGGIFNFPRPPARTPRSLGPRLRTSQRAQALFAIDGADNVHINSFRIEGPDMGIVDGDNNYARAIQLTDCLGVEISNMEISGWSGAAIYVQDPSVRQSSMLDAQQIYIHDNFLHNNQHVGSNGYGVDVQNHAYAQIEHNVLDNNRHSLTASGQPGDGYRALGNLQLRGGGQNGHWYDDTIHVFDIHGDADCWYATSHSFFCGNAGTRFEFLNNAMQYSADNDIKVRGTPTDLVLIDGNVFARGDDAVAESQGMDHITITSNNQYGVDTFGEYGVCDVDGDGKDDLFLATGASWWFMSGAKMQWTFLSEHTDRLADIRLGDFDGDHRCDVLARDPVGGVLRYASGAGSAWTTLGGPYAGIPMEEIRVGDFNGDHVTDLFHRAQDGGWFYASPGRFDWTYLGGSGLDLASLQLGDFDGDGVTDIVGQPGGALSISSGGTQPWAPLASGPVDLATVQVANVDGLPGDDLVRFVKDSSLNGHWEMSSGARAPWQTIASSAWTDPGGGVNATDRVHTYLGRFNGTGSADLLTLDDGRRSRISTATSRALTPHGLYEY